MSSIGRSAGLKVFRPERSLEAMLALAVLQQIEAVVLG